jgi:hypothetical protein
VFPPDGKPFQLKDADLVPLERRAVARLEVESLSPVDVSVGAQQPPRVVNDPVGRFALWGFSAPQTTRPARQLKSADEGSD